MVIIRVGYVSFVMIHSTFGELFDDRSKVSIYNTQFSSLSQYQYQDITISVYTRISLNIYTSLITVTVEVVGGRSTLAVHYPPHWKE